MKTMTRNFWMLGIMIACTFSLTSCYFDEDYQVSNCVSGHWFGDMDMWIDGERSTGSEVEFNPTVWGYARGTGIEVDYYRRGSVTHYFDWQVRDGVIYMMFDNPDLDCAILDYRLTYNYFSGYIADPYSLENMTHFNLRNYDRYWNDYGYGGYLYSRELTMDTDSISNDSTSTRSTTENNKPKCIRGVNKK